MQRTSKNTKDAHPDDAWIAAFASFSWEDPSKKLTTQLFSAIRACETVKDKASLSKIYELIKAGANLFAKQEGKTPAELAAELGYWECVKLFIDIFIRLHKSKITNPILEVVLQKAVKQNQCAIVQTLLEQKISCNQYDSVNGNIALYWALHNKNSRMLALLLPHADTTKVDKDGKSIFELANEIADEESIKTLAKHFYTKEMTSLSIIQREINSFINSMVNTWNSIASAPSNENQNYVYIEPGQVSNHSLQWITTSYPEMPNHYLVPAEQSIYYPLPAYTYVQPEVLTHNNEFNNQHPTTQRKSSHLDTQGLFALQNIQANQTSLVQQYSPNKP